MFQYFANITRKGRIFMQFKPVKDYKPPAYLAKAAMLLAITGTLSGCADFPGKPVNPQGTQEVQLEGKRRYQRRNQQQNFCWMEML